MDLIFVNFFKLQQPTVYIGLSLFWKQKKFFKKREKLCLQLHDSSL